MVSIGKLAAGQASYYERQVARGRDDYYSGRGEAPGEWTGRGAAALRLAGQVEAAQFNALMAGLDPSDEALERRLRDSRGEPKVVGFDLTFSAPKSVSVLFAAGDEQTAGQLIAAHESAVRAALEYVEDTAVKVRRGQGGAIIEPGEGVIAAAYRHRMSRSLDPQLHTHVVCANVARGPDGRWTALDGRHLYEHAKTAGYLYQAHLRAEVRERLGLEWGPVTKGAAELRELPAEVLRARGLAYGLAVVKAGSVAERAGLRVGDIIYAVNQKRLRTIEDFTRFVAEEAGGSLALLVRRGKSDFYVPMDLSGATPGAAKDKLLRT
jgi:conjugative relaxase-like TrwC/TraI family protein